MHSSIVLAVFTATVVFSQDIRPRPPPELEDLFLELLDKYDLQQIVEEANIKEASPTVYRVPNGHHYSDSENAKPEIGKPPSQPLAMPEVPAVMRPIEPHQAMPVSDPIPFGGLPVDPVTHFLDPYKPISVLDPETDPLDPYKPISMYDPDHYNLGKGVHIGNNVFNINVLGDQDVDHPDPHLEYLEHLANLHYTYKHAHHFPVLPGVPYWHVQHSVPDKPLITVGGVTWDGQPHNAAILPKKLSESDFGDFQRGFASDLSSGVLVPKELPRILPRPVQGLNMVRGAPRELDRVIQFLRREP